MTHAVCSEKKETTYNGETFCKKLVNSNGTALIPAAVIPHGHAEALVSRFFYGSGADLHPNFKKTTHLTFSISPTRRTTQKHHMEASAKPWTFRSTLTTILA